MDQTLEPAAVVRVKKMRVPSGEKAGDVSAAPAPSVSSRRFETLDGSASKICVPEASVREKTMNLGTCGGSPRANAVAGCRAPTMKGARDRRAVTRHPRCGLNALLARMRTDST